MYLTHITVEGERWDQIAMRYYGNAFCYEHIIVANPTIPLNLVLPSGLTLRIPIVDEHEQQHDASPWLG